MVDRDSYVKQGRQVSQRRQFISHGVSTGSGSDRVRCKSEPVATAPGTDLVALRVLCRRSETPIQRLDQLVDVILGRVQHHAGADDVAVQAAFANQHAALFGFLKDLQD